MTRMEAIEEIANFIETDEFYCRAIIFEASRNKLFTEEEIKAVLAMLDNKYPKTNPKIRRDIMLKIFEKLSLTKARIFIALLNQLETRCVVVENTTLLKPNDREIYRKFKLPTKAYYSFINELEEEGWLVKIIHKRCKLYFLKCNI